MSPQFCKLALSIAGGLSLVLALAGLTGAHLQALEDTHLAYGWVPGQSLIAFIPGGLSLLCLAFGFSRLSQIGGLIVLAMAGVLLLEQAGLMDAGVHQALNPLRIETGEPSSALPRFSLHTLLSFGALGLALLLMGSRSPPAHRGFVLAVLSAFIFALPVAKLLGFALDLAGGTGGWLAMAFTGPAHLLVSGAVLTFAWRDLPPSQREQLPWPPLLLIVGVLVATLLLWEALRTEEHAHLRAQVNQQTHIIRAELQAGVAQHIESLARLSSRWARTDTPLGRELAAALLRNTDGLERIESVRADGSVVWRIDGGAALAPPPAGQRTAVLLSARSRGQATLSEVIADGRDTRLLIAIPSERRAGTDAAVLLANYRLQELLSHILYDPHSDEHAVSIFADDIRVYQRGETADGTWTQSLTADLYGRQWRVRVTPTPALVAAAHSPLPGTVVFGGLLLTLALAWVHYLAQKATLQARDLRAEVARREQAEAALQRTNEALEQRVRERTEDLSRNAEALAHEKERLAVTLDSIGDGVITTDTVGRISSMSPVAQALTGWTAERATGTHVSTVLRLVDENNATIESRVDALLRGDVIKPLPRIVVLIIPSGERKFVSESVAPIRDRQGKLLGTVLVLHDVTGVRKLEDELFRAKNLESIGLLAGGIAHDFNNIMTGILGNVSVAKLYTRPEDPAYENLEEAEKGFVRARDLTLQLLTFSRGGAPVRKTASIAELLQDTATFMLRGSNVRHQLVIAPDLWPASIDAGQISQALNNLLINAKQAMPDGGTLTITAQNVRLGADEKPLTPGNYVKITLRDTGVGITAEDLPRLFEPYFTTKEIGTGLGLPNTYTIIRRHDGHIEVESTPGVGTTFTIYLPAVPEARQAPRVERKQQAMRGQGRVLLMDDEDSVREVAAKMLRALGYETAVAANGQEALEAFNEHIDAFQPFDAVILDLTVKGGMGGVETLRRLRQRDPGARVIASSGYSTDPVMADYAKYGFDAIVVKPYRLEELSRAVHQVMGNGSGASRRGGD